MFPTDTMQSPMMGNPFMMGGGQSSSMGNFNPGEKIAKEVTKTLSSIISQQAAEGYQHLTSMGVPIADAGKHILDQLMQMTGNQRSNDALMPPTQNGMPGQQQRPPQPPNPNPMVKNQDTPNNPDAQAPDPSQQPSDSNPQASLAQIPTAQQTGRRFLHLSQTPGFFDQNKIGPNGELILGGPLGAMFGVSPNAYATANNSITQMPANTAEQTAVSNAITPPTQYEQKALQGQGYQGQREAMQNELTAYEKQIEELQKQQTTGLQYRNPLEALAGGKGFYNNNLDTTIAGLQKQKAILQNRMGKLSKQNPNYKQPQGGSQGQLFEDSKGNRAYKMPDGSWRDA